MTTCKSDPTCKRGKGRREWKRKENSKLSWTILLGGSDTEKGRLRKESRYTFSTVTRSCRLTIILQFEDISIIYLLFWLPLCI